MEYKFSIQIDDEKHSLSSSNGISIKYLWELLRDLYKSIAPEDEPKLTLNAIRGNCYALDFITAEKQYEENFIRVHKNIQELSDSDLAPEEREYSRTLKKVLGGKYYLNAYDSNRTKVATIKDLSREKRLTKYFVYKTIYGVVSELGGKNLYAEKKHIKVHGVPYNIDISKDVDQKLKNYYGTRKLKIKIKAKMSFDNDRIVSAELVDFTEVGENSLVENLEKEGYIDLELIKNTSTVNDIIDRIYGNTK
jgi:hypothetical protein